MFWMLEWHTQPEKRHVESVERLVRMCFPALLAREAALTGMVIRLGR